MSLSLRPCDAVMCQLRASILGDVRELLQVVLHRKRCYCEGMPPPKRMSRRAHCTMQTRCDHGVVPTTHLTRIARKAPRMSLSYLCIYCLDIELAAAGNTISTCFPGAQRNMDNGTGYSCMQNLIDYGHCLSSFHEDTRRLHSGKALSLG